MCAPLDYYYTIVELYELFIFQVAIQKSVELEISE